MARTSPTNARLDRVRILRTAIEFADAKGIDKLNMRMLASQLSCAVMSLYTHIDNKNALLSAMIDVVAREIEIPDSGQPWRKAITTIAISAHAALHRHPWALSLWAGSASPAKLDHQESILRVLREAGFSVALACHGYHAITMHTIGFTMQALEYPPDAKSVKAAVKTFLSETDVARIPYFVEHLEHHARHPEPDGAFTFALDLILDGLERLREEP